MDEVIEFLDDCILANGKEYRDFWMIPYDIVVNLSPEMSSRIVNHLIRHEIFLCDNTDKSVPLEAFYVLLGSRLPYFLN